MVGVRTRCAGVFAGTKGVCLRQGASGSEVDFLGRAEPWSTLRCRAFVSLTVERCAGGCSL